MPALATEERGPSAKMMECGASRKITKHGFIGRHGVHQPMRMATPGLVILRMASAAAVGTSIIGRMDVAAALRRRPLRSHGHLPGNRGPPSDQTPLPDRTSRQRLRRGRPGTLRFPSRPPFATHPPPAGQGGTGDQHGGHPRPRPAASHASPRLTPPRTVTRRPRPPTPQVVARPSATRPVSSPENPSAPGGSCRTDNRSNPATVQPVSRSLDERIADSA